MHGNENHFLQQISPFLGSYFICLAVMNGIAAYYCWQKLKNNQLALAWIILAAALMIVSPLAYAGMNGSPQTMKLISVPEGFRSFVDGQMANAVTYTVGTTLALVVLYLFRSFFAKPVVAWVGLNVSLILMGMSMVDQEFSAIVTKPDNVPIVAMVFLLGFFTWLATHRAVENDERTAKGLPPLEAEESEKVLVWPDLVYTEMICMVVLTAILILWAIALRAPLEEPASGVTIGGTTLADRNVISGNTQLGIALTGVATTSNVIVGNYIGVDANGGALGNTLFGIRLTNGAQAEVGGTGADEGNVIANNGNHGVHVHASTTTDSPILGNSIYGNTGLGINLNAGTQDANLVTANDVGDGDTGPNDLLNYVVMTLATESGGTVSVDFDLDAPAGDYRIEFFTNPLGTDGSGYGEGETFAGAAPVTHTGSGVESFSTSFAGVAGDTLAATTTEDLGAGSYGSTSEFSAVFGVVAAQAPTLSSAANQAFWVGKALTANSPITVAEGLPATITVADDIRIRIPSGFNMVWDTLDVTATVTGTASGKVSATVSYEDAGATLVLDVSSDFAFGDTVVVADLGFMDFTASSGTDNLDLEVANDDVVTATDVSTVEILPRGTPTISSEFDQSFRVGDPPVTMEILTIQDDNAAPVITAANDIRVRIPTTFNMTWDVSDLSAVLLGSGSGKVSTTVSYEDGGKTLVIDVLTDFDPGDLLTVDGLSFDNFAAASIDDHLELEVDDDGSVVAEDDKAVFIVLILVTPDIASSANQSFTVGSGPTAARLIRITDDDVIPQVKAATDLRIRIPATFPMTWDVTITSANISGPARAKLSTSVTYEDGGKTLVVDVLTDFVAGDWINVGNVDFMSFTSAAAPDRLELEVANDGGLAVSLDDKTKEIFGTTFNLDVWPSTVAGSHLPTNGTNETVEFTVTNTGTGTDEYDLLTATSPGTVITVISITGPGITQGANPDSARISGLGAGDNVVATVTYSAAMAPVGTVDTLTFLARSVAVPGDTDAGRLDLTLIRPQVTLGKGVSPTGTQPPGTDLTYTMTVTNAGTADAAQVALVDSIPSDLEFQVGSEGTSLPAGITAVVEFSDDDGASWTYTPVSGGCGAAVGYDSCVSRIRWTLQAPLPSTGPDNTGDLSFSARIRS